MRFFVALCFAALLSSSFATQYKITTYTGSSYWAGTDANIRITLHGTLNSRAVTIKSTGRGVLESDAVDTFTVNTDVDLGDISYIDIQRDNSGRGPGWFLDKIDVKRANIIVEFPCDKWIKEEATRLTALRCGHPRTASFRIVGGSEASKGAWPWQVTIDNIDEYGKHWCGGSIISGRWILSAAHCFFDDQRASNYKITAGQHDLNNRDGSEQEREIKRIIIHEYYDSNSNDYDIALLELKNPIKYDHDKRVQPVCMASTAVAAGTECYVTGWGALFEGGSGPKVLHQAKVPLVDHQVCKNSFTSYYNRITDQMLCAGYASGGIDSCQGDSGGPLVCRQNGAWKLHGAVSWGIGCARPNKYGVYADIVQLRKWVFDNME